MVKLADLRQQYLSIRKDIDSAIASVVEDCEFVGGKHVESFEKNFARYVGVKHCTGVGNGSDALFVSLKMLGIGPGDEVITTANSFIATPEAITRAGAKIRFVDCDKRTYNIDVSKMEKSINRKTAAILPVHIYGQPADMQAINEIAQKHDLKVIEDACQAHGSKYKDKMSGNLGDCACFSFFPSKNLGAYGDGGAILTNDDKLAMKARMFANHGRISKYDHEFEGINTRLDGLQAAILDVKLRHLDDWNNRRIGIAKKYDKELADFVVVPFVLPGVKHVYHLYVIQVKDRGKVAKALADKGISTGIHYPTPLPFLRAYSYLKQKKSDFPNVVPLSSRILSIPMHAELSDEQVNEVIVNLKSAVGSGG